jgi:hypothetical protein
MIDLKSISGIGAPAISIQDFPVQDNLPVPHRGAKKPREKENPRGKPKRKGGIGNSVYRLPDYVTSAGGKGYSHNKK